MIWATLLENTAMAGGLAGIVALVCRFQRARPALCHLLWLLVFTVLVMPPTPLTANLGGGVRDSVSGYFSPTPDSSLPAYVAPAWGGTSLASSWGSEELDAVLPSSVEPEPIGSLPLAAGATAATSPTLWARVEAVVSRVSLSAWAIGWWALGSLVALLFMQQRIARFHRGVRAARPASGPIVDEVSAVAQRLGMRAPEVRLLEGVGSPSIWCFGPARLLWPTRGGALSRAGRAPSLIAHELAHIARRDTWVARLEVLAIAACWWHPLFWLIRRQVHVYAELSCDAWALWAYPQDRREYAEALIGAHEETIHAPVALQGLCATNSDFKDFERRLDMILRDKVSRGVSKGAAALAIAGTLLLLPSASQDYPESVKEHQEGKQVTECAGCAAGVEHQCVDQKLALEKALGVAEKLFQAGDMPSALDAFESALRLAPDDPRAHARLAYIQIGLKMVDEARVHLNHAVEHGDNVLIAAYNLACCDALSGQHEAGLKNLAMAIRYGFSDVELMSTDSDLDGLRELPGFAAALKLCGISAQLRSQLNSEELEPERAHALHTSLYRIASSDGPVVADYAMSAHGMGDYKASFEAFGRQAKLGFNRPTALYNRGCALARLGKTDAAFEMLEEAVRAGMSYPMVVDDEDLESLREDARWPGIVEGLSAQTESVDKVARALYEGNLLDATDLLEGIQTDPNAAADTRVWSSLKRAELMMQKAQYADALEAFEHAAAGDYAVDEAAFGMASALAALGLDDVAEERLRAAIELGFQDEERVAALAEGAHLKSAKVLAALAGERAARAKGLAAKEEALVRGLELRFSDVTARERLDEARLRVDDFFVGRDAAPERVELAELPEPVELDLLLEFRDFVEGEAAVEAMGSQHAHDTTQLELETRQLELRKLELELELKRLELRHLEQKLELQRVKAKAMPANPLGKLQ